jgi:hypothetical protein
MNGALCTIAVRAPIVHEWRPACDAGCGLLACAALLGCWLCWAAGSGTYRSLSVSPLSMVWQTLELPGPKLVLECWLLNGFLLLVLAGSVGSSWVKLVRPLGLGWVWVRVWVNHSRRWVTRVGSPFVPDPRALLTSVLVDGQKMRRISPSGSRKCGKSQATIVASADSMSN